MIKKYINKFLFLALSILVITSLSCSTKKNTMVRRAYHNLTSRFNVYFNGNESLKEGIVDIEKNHEDNYLKILPVFKLSTKEKVQASNPMLDKAIEKATKDIQLHSMFFKGIEFVKTIDDAWMLIGKANFYKQDYFASFRTFEFVKTRFSKNPIRFDAMLWMAKTYIQTNNFSSALALLDNVQNSKSTDKSLKNTFTELPLAYAELYLRQNSYDKAIKYLEKSLELKQKKKVKTRVHFILGQLYLQKNNLKKASEFFLLALKGSPNYLMSFNSKINLAKCYDGNAGKSKDITNVLKKMLKDDKNKEYLDQIYFALAEVAIKQNKEKDAIEYLRKSVSKSVSNNYQKAVSSLKLADIYFSYPDYKNSSIYYDTALAVLPVDFDNYDNIKLKTQTLHELVFNLIIIETEDSLQALAKMSDGDRNKIIDKLIDIERKKEQEKQEDEFAKSQIPNSSQSNNIQNNPMMPLGQSSWYFYNPSAIQRGYNEFLKKWGNRKLEDNWRLSNKQEVSFVTSEQNLDSTVDENAPKQNSSNPLDRSYYTKNIPFTKELLTKSNESIQKAYLNAGILFYEGIDDKDKSILTLETLLKRYPTCPQKINACYYLYIVYNAKDLNAKALDYKNIIISEFPESDYAKLLTDPYYYKKINEKLNTEKLFYSTTYNLFINEDYVQTLTNCNLALTKFQENDLTPKFEYLKAVSLGKINGNDTMEVTLNRFINKYPKHPLNLQAKNILDYFQKNIKQNYIAPIDTLLPKSKTSFIPSDNSSHLYIIILEETGNIAQTLKNSISNFNSKYYGMESYSINSIIGFTQMQRIISVNNMKNKESAMLYYNTIKNDDVITNLLKNQVYSTYVISTENYSTLYKTRDTEAYKVFFQKNYLK